MKSVLCYGDSNTWGYDPRSQERYARKERWTGILAEELGAGFMVIEEGLNGRTTVWDDPLGGYKNGREYLEPCLESHRPVDLVILFLGTNDLKARFSLTPRDIALGVSVLAALVSRSAAGPGGGPPLLLLLAPPPVCDCAGLSESFSGAPEKSRRLAGCFQEVAEEHFCQFLDTGGHIRSSGVDGIHLDTGEHRKLAEALLPRVRALLA